LLGFHPKTQNQKLKATSKAANQKLVAFHKSFRFIPEACLFLKAVRVAPAFITRTSTGDGAYTTTNISLQGMCGWPSVPENQKRVIRVTVVARPPRQPDPSRLQ
jgi:hypothetical protein